MDTTESQQTAETADRDYRLIQRATDLGCGRIVREKLANCSYAEALYLFLQCEELCRKASELDIRDKVQPCIEAGNVGLATSVVDKAYAERDSLLGNDAILQFAQ